MFDLNLSLGSNWKEKFKEDEAPVTTTSWVVNGEEGSSYNGTWSTRASPENSYTFNFGVLNRNDPVEKDRYLTESEPITREFFPVSGLCELNMGRPDNNGNGNWINQGVVPSKLVQQQHQQVQHVKPRKSRRGPPSRSSQYRGVTFYRRTGRWESHIWDCGKQIYLGGFDTALAAARAYDRAAIKFRGVDADINFNHRDYEGEINRMKSLSKEEFVHRLRGFSKYRCGRWEFPGKTAIQCNLSESRNEGSQHDLDLNLGISTSSPKENESSEPYDVHNARKSGALLIKHSQLQMDSSLKGLPLTSLAGLNPKSVSFYEERLAENRIEWGWQVDRRAASSGFSSPASASS